MIEVRTAIHIQAPPKKVWSVLTDFSSYPNWNPFIKYIQGPLEVGEKLRVQIQPPKGSLMTFYPTLLKVDTNKELRWLGRVFFPGVFDGEHIFELIDARNGTCTFIHREIFSGILVTFLRNQLDTDTRRGFELMNMELKKLCEQR